MEDQPHFIATGIIGTPIAEINAPDAEDDVKAIAKHETELLDERKDVTERVL